MGAKFSVSATVLYEPNDTSSSSSPRKFGSSYYYNPCHYLERKIGRKLTRLPEAAGAQKVKSYSWQRKGDRNPCERINRQTCLLRSATHKYSHQDTTTGPSLKRHPDYFLHYLCCSHTSIFRMDSKQLFPESVIRHGIVMATTWDPSCPPCQPNTAKSQFRFAARALGAARGFLLA